MRTQERKEGTERGELQGVWQRSFGFVGTGGSVVGRKEGNLEVVRFFERRTELCFGKKALEVGMS